MKVIIFGIVSEYLDQFIQEIKQTPVTVMPEVKVINSNLKKVLNFINVQINLSAQGQLNDIHRHLAIHNTYAGFV